MPGRDRAFYCWRKNNNFVNLDKTIVYIVKNDRINGNNYVSGGEDE